jgi:hypothetical protein
MNKKRKIYGCAIPPRAQAGGMERLCRHRRARTPPGSSVGHPYGKRVCTAHTTSVASLGIGINGMDALDGYTKVKWN